MLRPNQCRIKDEMYKTMGSKIFLVQIYKLQEHSLKINLVCIVTKLHFLVTQDLVLDFRPAAKEAKQQSRKEWKTKLVFIFYSPK